MKVSEIEIGVTYQPRSYESVRSSVRVVLEEGDTIETAAQFAAEQAAIIASNGKPDSYKDCMDLLRRNVGEQALVKMQKKWHLLLERTKELKEKIFLKENFLEALRTAEDRYQKLKQMSEFANCWSEYQKVLLDLANAEVHNQQLESETKVDEAKYDEF
ncbi:MAG: hypothetical protein QNJ68_03470 [Microcoleaceae cyanobacterium MO_207.B10]|nr:hypothetical protein [Microcoleaceae cyanobacterium MO_207.B10]